MNLCKKFFIVVCANKEWSIFIAILLSLIIIGKINDYSRQTTLESNMKFSKASIQNSIKSVVESQGGSGCNEIIQYCEVVNHENNILVSYDKKDFNRTPVTSSLLEVCYTCRERNKTPYDKWLVAHGRRPKNKIFFSYPSEIEDYIVKRANNPDSLKDIQCSPAQLTDFGWPYDCSYRMTNKFGGIELYSSLFYISKDNAWCSLGCKEL